MARLVLIAGVLCLLACVLSAPDNHDCCAHGTDYDDGVVHDADDSEQARPEACYLKSETGSCRGAFPRWYFDVEENKCNRFIYGGCGGNDNNFETEKQCTDYCL